MAAAAYCLSHAINKLTEHQAINIRTSTSFVQYPSMAEMRDFDIPGIQAMIAKADVVVFHSYIQPILAGLNLTKEMLKGKKVLVYFHGSEYRYLGKDLLAECDQAFEKYQVLMSTPDMMIDAPPGAKWLPVTRSLQEIRDKYGMPEKDQAASEAFGAHLGRIVLCHAPSDEQKKGSETFYRAITKVVRVHQNATYLTIRNQPWDACLRLISSVDVYFDQDPPWMGAYGMVSVEASAFKAAVITKIKEPVEQVMKQVYGRRNPFITFENLDDLVAKTYLLVEQPDLRKQVGQQVYEYCMAVHDESSVVPRFLKIVGEMS